jgi:superoxide dismutase
MSCRPLVADPVYRLAGAGSPNRRPAKTTCALLALDVYEHAYARDFGATPDGRKQYVEAFFRNLDWDHVNRQLIQAEAAKRGADESGAAESPEFAPATG